jgi:hypothetical protein
LFSVDSAGAEVAGAVVLAAQDLVAGVVDGVVSATSTV